MRFGTWNIRSVYRPGTLGLVASDNVGNLKEIGITTEIRLIRLGMEIIGEPL